MLLFQAARMLEELRQEQSHVLSVEKARKSLEIQVTTLTVCIQFATKFVFRIFVHDIYVTTFIYRSVCF